MKKWIERHFVLTWVICSILFAGLVHVLFSINASDCLPCLEAKWSAGDILTYVSTISLGLLAVWQNKRFKEENDASQQRLEDLTREANELSLKTRIIGIESENLMRLKEAMDGFSSACDPQELTTKLVNGETSSNPALTTLSVLTLAEKHIDDNFFALCRELRTDPESIKKNADNPLVLRFGSYYFAAKEFVKVARGGVSEQLNIKIELLGKCKIDFLAEREAYLIKREKMLSQVIYGNLSLKDIKEMYYNMS